MKITDIAPQVHNKQRKSIFVDGKYAFSLDETDAIKLKIGSEITPEQLDKLNVESNLSKATSKALDYLSRAPHTRHDIIKKLEQKGFDSDISQMAADNLCEMGIINDTEYASLYIEYAKEKYYGPSKIRYELTSHGVDGSVINEVMNSMECSDADELSDMLMQKYRGYDFNDPKVKQRATRYLASRGFGFDVINRAIHQISRED